MNITIGGKIREVTDKQMEQIKELLLETELRTPGYILFWSGAGDKKINGLFFNNNEQVLNYFLPRRQWTVSTSQNQIVRGNRKLVPINREDLKPGDVVYRSDTEDRSFDQIDDYGIVLNPDETAYPTYENEIHIDDLEYSFWWKVI